MTQFDKMMANMVSAKAEYENQQRMFEKEILKKGYSLLPELYGLLVEEIAKTDNLFARRYPNVSNIYEQIVSIKAILNKNEEHREEMKKNREEKRKAREDKANAKPETEVQEASA